MDIEAAREYCLSKKATTEDTPFGEDVLVIRVMGKMFLCINLNTPDRITMKCDPEYALELRERYNAIEGAWHFNKKYWNQVFLDGDADDRLIKHLFRHHYSSGYHRHLQDRSYQRSLLPTCFLKTLILEIQWI